MPHRGSKVWRSILCWRFIMTYIQSHLRQVKSPTPHIPMEKDWSDGTCPWNKSCSPTPGLRGVSLSIPWDIHVPLNLEWTRKYAMRIFLSALKNHRYMCYSECFLMPAPRTFDVFCHSHQRHFSLVQLWNQYFPQGDPVGVIPGMSGADF